MKLFPVIAVAIALVLISAAGCEYSTANLQNVQVCAETDSENMCTADASSFASDTDEIFVTGEIQNAPEDTELTITWTYLGEEGDEPEEIDVVKLTTEDTANTFYSSLEAPAAGWPGGDYEIVLDLGTDNSDTVTKSFTVEGGAGPQPKDEVISELMVCDDLGVADDACPGDKSTFSPQTPEIFMTAVLGDVPVGTEVRITWRYLGGEGGVEQDIDSVVLEAPEETPVPFSSNYAAENDWPVGDYEIVIELDGRKAATKEFSVK